MLIETKRQNKKQPKYVNRIWYRDEKDNNNNKANKQALPWQTSIGQGKSGARTAGSPCTYREISVHHLSRNQRQQLRSVVAVAAEAAWSPRN